MTKFYVFPGDFTFEKVKQCPGRVYLLECKNNQKRNFYYMQEPDASVDEEHEKKVAEILNGPPAAPAQPAS